MPKADARHTRPSTGEKSENPHFRRLGRELERIGSDLMQLRWLVFSHRELMRHTLEGVTADHAAEIEASYQLSRITEDRLEEIDGQLQRAVVGVLGALRPENAHG